MSQRLQAMVKLACACDGIRAGRIVRRRMLETAPPPFPPQPRVQLSPRFFSDDKAWTPLPPPPGTEGEDEWRYARIPQCVFVAWRMESLPLELSDARRRLWDCSQLTVHYQLIAMAIRVFPVLQKTCSRPNSAGSTSALSGVSLSSYWVPPGHNTIILFFQFASHSTVNAVLSRVLIDSYIKLQKWSFSRGIRVSKTVSRKPKVRLRGRWKCILAVKTIVKWDMRIWRWFSLFPCQVQWRDRVYRSDKM